MLKLVPTCPGDSSAIMCWNPILHVTLCQFRPESEPNLRSEPPRLVGCRSVVVIKPLSPTMVNWNAGSAGGILGFLRGQLRLERYFHFFETSQLTAQFALADPVSTSFADFSVPPNNLLEDNG